MSYTSAAASSVQSPVTIHGTGRFGGASTDSKNSAGKSDVSITIHGKSSEHPLATLQASAPAIQKSAADLQQSVAITSEDFAAGFNPASEGAAREDSPLSPQAASTTGPGAHKVDHVVFKVKNTGTSAFLGISDKDALMHARSALATLKWDATGLVMSTPEYTRLHWNLEGLAANNPRLYNLVRTEIYDTAHAEHHCFGDEEPVEQALPAAPVEAIEEVSAPVEPPPLQTVAPATVAVRNRCCNPCLLKVLAVASGVIGVAQVAIANQDPDLEQDQWSAATQFNQYIVGGAFLAVGAGLALASRYVARN